ncbi:MAG: ATP phosphoribosyltransferase [Anaerolineae bacterium]
MNRRTDIRLSLPSKGRLGQASLDFLAACGLPVEKPNPRQYAARIPTLPGLTVLFQRPGDIVVSVRDGSVDFGITGMDMVAERRGNNVAVLVLHDALGFGHCRLALAVPEEWENVHTMRDLAALARPLRVATKFPHLTGGFLERHGVAFSLIEAEGALEAAPAIGYADFRRPGLLRPDAARQPAAPPGRRPHPALPGRPDRQPGRPAKAPARAGRGASTDRVQRGAPARRGPRGRGRQYAGHVAPGHRPTHVRTGNPRRTLGPHHLPGRGAGWEPQLVRRACHRAPGKALSDRGRVAGHRWQRRRGDAYYLHL